LTFDTVESAPPEPDRVVLNNGMVIYLLEDHELPLITIGALMRTGSWLDPADKIGLAALTGTVMRTGGGGGFSAAQVEDELAQVGGRMTITIGRQSGTASLDILKRDLPDTLRVFAGAIRAPAFGAASVELAKLQAIERIRRREDEPDSIASREFTKLLYGPGHPAAREGSIESVARITREDLLAFHQRTIHPNGIILGVTGDFMKDEMAALLRDAFGDWEMGPVPKLTMTDVPEREAERAVIHFIKKNTSQTHLRAGRLSVKETDPDYIPLVVANDILAAIHLSAGSTMRYGPREVSRTRSAASSERECTTRACGSCGPKPNCLQPWKSLDSWRQTSRECARSLSVTRNCGKRRKPGRIHQYLTFPARRRS
jgi:predicted Zn-dependent peptidase